MGTHKIYYSFSRQEWIIECPEFCAFANSIKFAFSIACKIGKKYNLTIPDSREFYAEIDIKEHHFFGLSCTEETQMKARIGSAVLWNIGIAK